MTKDAVLEVLWKNAESYISGEELGKKLSVSRAAVWKAIEQLRSEGYRIESVTNKGYRLSPENDVLSAEGVRKYLKSPRIDLQYYRSISSTNTVLKKMAAEGAPEGLTLIAGAQTEGRGRMGRNFYSPSDSGIYMSLLLRPEMKAADVTSITACAAVAVAETLEELAGEPASIKWVNDVFMGGRKVCGILTEGSIDCENGIIQHLVVGIGINTGVPSGDFPEEIRNIAGAAFRQEKIPELRCRVAAGVLDRIMGYYEHLAENRFYPEYKSRSMVLGKPVSILSAGQDPEPADALDIDPDFALVVRCASGEIRRLNSGEVSIRVR